LGQGGEKGGEGLEGMDQGIGGPNNWGWGPVEGVLGWWGLGQELSTLNREKEGED